MEKKNRQYAVEGYKTEQEHVDAIEKLTQELDTLFEKQGELEKQRNKSTVSKERGELMIQMANLDPEMDKLDELRDRLILALEELRENN